MLREILKTGIGLAKDLVDDIREKVKEFGEDEMDRINGAKKGQLRIEYDIWLDLEEEEVREPVLSRVLEDIVDYDYVECAKETYTEAKEIIVDFVSDFKIKADSKEKIFSSDEEEVLKLNLSNSVISIILIILFSTVLIAYPLFAISLFKYFISITFVLIIINVFLYLLFAKTILDFKVE